MCETTPVHHFQIIEQALHSTTKIKYSDKYMDATFEYRLVTLPLSLLKDLKSSKAPYTDSQLYKLGVRQSQGWMNIDSHVAEPNILIFKRALNTHSGKQSRKQHLLEEQ